MNDAVSDFPELSKSWKEDGRGWFESIKFWPRKERIIQVTAKQTPTRLLFKSSATASFTIIINEKIIVSNKEVPWEAPIGEQPLLLQIFISSKTLDFRHRRFEKILEHFCLQFPNFRPHNFLYVRKRVYLTN